MSAIAILDGLSERLDYDNPIRGGRNCALSETSKNQYLNILLLVKTKLVWVNFFEKKLETKF